MPKKEHVVNMHAQGFQESNQHTVDKIPKDKVSSENKITNKKLSLDGYQLKDTSRNEISIDTCQIEGNKIPIEGKQEVSSSQKRARFQTNQTLGKFS